MAKQTKTAIVAVALPAKLEELALNIAGAIQESMSLSEVLGDLTREAGAIIKRKPEMLDPFIDACKKMCAAVGLAEGSVKVYLSNIRGVIRAMVAGYAPKAGMGLRAMYDAAPKGTGRQKAGARHSTDKADKGEANESAMPAPAASRGDAKRDAIVALFGHCDDELMAAIEWAVKNEPSFVKYAQANVWAEQAPAVTPIKKAA